MKLSTIGELVKLDDKVQRHNHQLLFDDKIDTKQFVAKQRKRKLIYEKQQELIKSLSLKQKQ